jgi:hypothetical protein
VSQEFTSELVMLARRPGSRSVGGVRVTGLALDKMPGAVRDEAQKAMIAVAMWWREKRAPAHFDVRAYDRYGNIEPNVYKERTGPMGWMVTKGYTEPAQRMGGKVRPLVRTGKLRQMILHGSYTAQASGSQPASKMRLRTGAMYDIRPPLAASHGSGAGCSAPARGCTSGTG